MITLQKQMEYNTKFISYFKSLMSLHNVSSGKLLSKFKAFEENNIVDIEEVPMIILKSMLDIPYYKEFKEVNILVKFRILIETLELIKIDEIDDNLINKLHELRNTFKKK
jgi:hypothetical protein